MMIGMNVSVYNVDNGHNINGTMYVNSLIYCEVIHCIAVFHTLLAMFTTTARGERGQFCHCFMNLGFPRKTNFAEK